MIFENEDNNDREGDILIVKKNSVQSNPMSNKIFQEIEVPEHRGYVDKMKPRLKPDWIDVFDEMAAHENQSPLKTK